MHSFALESKIRRLIPLSHLSVKYEATASRANIKTGEGETAAAKGKLTASKAH